MNIKVELLNVIRYERKEDKKVRTMINYRVINDDSLANNDKYKGYSVLTSYYDGDEVFKKIPHKLCGTAVDMFIEKVPSVTNPLKETSLVKKINDISLV